MPQLKSTKLGDAAVVICERGEAWVRTLSNLLKSADIAIRHCHTLRGCVTLVAEAPASFVVVELDPADPLPGMRMLDSLSRQFPSCKWAVVLGRNEKLVYLAREVGAVHVATSILEAPQVADLVRRHLDRLPERATSVSEQIWSSLPWGEHHDWLTIDGKD